MLLKSRQKRTSYSNIDLTQRYDIDVNITTCVTCDKILDIHVDNSMTWNNHLNFLSIAAVSGVGSGPTLATCETSQVLFLGVLPFLPTF